MYGIGLTIHERGASDLAQSGGMQGDTAEEAAIGLEQKFQNGLALHLRGNLDEAKAIYEDVLSENQSHFDALHLLGIISHQSSELGRAVELISKAISIKAAFPAAHINLANALKDLKRHDEALASYDKAISLQPDYAAAHYNRGLLLQEIGRLEESISSYDKATSLQPDYPEAHNNRGTALQKLSRHAEALASYDKAISLKPAYAEAHNNRGNALKELNCLQDALASYEKAINLKPTSAKAHSNRGDALKELGRLEDAVASYDKAISLRPAYAEAYNNRGNALKELNRLADALASYDMAIDLKPTSAEAHSNRGNALKELCRLEDAVASYDKAISLRPAYAEAYSNRGNALKELYRYEDALASYDKAMELRPDDPMIYTNRGVALSDLCRAKEGLASIAKALALKPDCAEAYANMGCVLSELGRLDEAGEAIRQAIVLKPRRAAFYHALTEASQLTPGEPLIAAMEELAQDIATLDDKEQVFLHFALAKALADSDHERSFKHLLAGNALKRKQVPYNEAAMLGPMERTRALFTDDLMRSRAGLGDLSCEPLFIVGMPRSGSTLVEQILASHPTVFATGETDSLYKATVEFRGFDATGLHFPDAVASLSGEQLRQLGADYVARIKSLAPEAERIADKMLDNFRFAGLIHLALPNARIIHTRRNPIDTCFSCFSKLFVYGLDYTYDLGELGRYYRAYEALMTHWREVLPNGAVLEVQYEELVTDLEGQARRIVAHCGLEWDARCLDFHKTERQVRTASKTQVRRPLYTSSVGRARVFEAHLAPLLEALQPSKTDPGS